MHANKSILFTAEDGGVAEEPTTGRRQLFTVRCSLFTVHWPLLDSRPRAA
jgi:hypothetical protein